MAGNHEVVEMGNTSCNCSAFPSSSSVYHSTRIEELLQSQTNYKTALDFEIAASKSHWSEVQQRTSGVGDSSGGEQGTAHLTNSEIVLSLRRQFPQADYFFRDTEDDLVLGEKIAEGAQAEIFEAQNKRYPETRYVLKVFKEGWSVLDLQKQWPLGMLNRCTSIYSSRACSSVLGGTVLLNGRFAFQMFRCAGDLRKLIDKRMECNRNSNRFCAPFSDAELESNMQHIARGMKALHEDNIVHRDLKASNVLIQTSTKDRFKDLDALRYPLYLCQVADYECSVGVVGTGFWRAPEILLGVKAGKITPDLFTKEVDVYSFAMTCYEMITGKLPFEDLSSTNYDVVLQGDRPTLPEETKPWIKTLLSKCWHSNPKERPSFEEILKCIEIHEEENVSFSKYCNIM